jgi:hypothetical protein
LAMADGLLVYSTWSNRKSNLRTYFNTMIIFIVCGSGMEPVGIFYCGTCPRAYGRWTFLVEKNVLNRAGKSSVLYTFSIATFAWYCLRQNFEYQRIL